MSRIEITSKDAERIARQFSDLISAKGLVRIRRKAVNTVGAKVRKETRVIGPAIIGTSAAALMVQGKAASPGSDQPRLSAPHGGENPRRADEGGEAENHPAQGARIAGAHLAGRRHIRFRSIHRDGARFRLRKAGPLPERDLGGVYTNPGLAFTSEGYPELRALRRQGQRELPAIVSALIEAQMKRRQNIDANRGDRFGAGAAARRMRLPRRNRHVAPHEWDAGFVQRLIGATPAILIAFLGADEPDSRLTELNLDGRWAAYVVVGWNGQDQKARRLGAGAGFDLMHRAAAVLHTAVLTEENGERLPQVNVEGLAVETDSALDLANLWIGSIALVIELPLALDPGERCYGPLDDFLRIRGDIDLPTRPKISGSPSTCRNRRARWATVPGRNCHPTSEPAAS